MTGELTPRERLGLLREFEREIGRLVRRVRRVIAERAVAIHPELQPAAYLILAHLADAGPRRSAEIVELFDLDKGAVSRQVHQLVELGLVTRAPDPQDRRATILTASADAVASVEAVGRQRLERLEERMAGWSDAELSDFVHTMSRYNATLE